MITAAVASGTEIQSKATFGPEGGQSRGHFIKGKELLELCKLENKSLAEKVAKQATKLNTSEAAADHRGEPEERLGKANPQLPIA
ncbi:LOW QUALITY PROTEIN: hypothetical protein RvY_04756 [Ramazzottius varieornatus]|uniref:Uncharacterized protein n=1 Tax=Ramazzottius varieornatus TaxID=947166 RepID=A0A1D1V2M3_RAMVA|nr:LOW QUALITY PROTEIN: hypothetical protein RvY_04756 [Ramazzottius varieornatus]